MKVKCAGLSCLRRKKSSSNVEPLRNERKCVCLFCRNSHDEEEKASTRRKGVKCWTCCCFRRNEESDMGGFCCNKSPNAERPVEKDSSRKKAKCSICYRRRNKSLPELSTPRKKKEETRVVGGEEKAMGCFNCWKSPKVTCCSQARPTENGSSPRRGCAEAMGCLWCSKYASKKKCKSSMRLCWKRKEKLKPNHLASLVKSISFKSDSCEKDRSAVEEILRIGNGNIAARVFTYRQLAVATQSFSSECLLGAGGFGRVYKGHLEDTKEVVAVKQLDRQGYQGNREFLVEVLMLSLLNHKYLVNLLGYCADGDERILVYDYMPLGSLQDHLHDLAPDSKPLDWNTRMKIALGAARGLEYLHDTANPPVIYRDLKSSNILLDEDFTPKLSDFGLAKLGPVGEKMHISTRVMGTYGYCAPEYARTGKLTKMSDVYSLGVMLLELITGRKPMDKTRPAKEQVLIEWAAPLFKDKKKFVEMADPLLEGKFPVKTLYQAVAIAALCIQENETTRPVIKDIATALEFLVAQNSDGHVPGEPEMQRSTTGSTERFLSPSLSINNWLSFSTVNEEEIKNDVDHIT